VLDKHLFCVLVYFYPLDKFCLILA
jgi:hypothetical protein